MIQSRQLADWLVAGKTKRQIFRWKGIEGEKCHCRDYWRMPKYSTTFSFLPAVFSWDVLGKKSWARTRRNLVDVQNLFALAWRNRLSHKHIFFFSTSFLPFPFATPNVVLLPFYGGDGNLGILYLFQTKKGTSLLAHIFLSFYLWAVWVPSFTGRETLPRLIRHHT